MDAATWDERYAGTGYVWTTDPNVFLADEVAALPPGRALDLACGEGRNAVWLAERGWSVTGVDFSAVGLDKARRLAADHGVGLALVCADVTAWSPAPGAFDLVAVLYLQLAAADRRRALAAAARALAPGGTLLVVAHHRDNLAGGTGGPQDPTVLYGEDDVTGDLGAAGVEVAVERAERVERPVAGAERPALDLVVRARR